MMKWKSFSWNSGTLTTKTVDFEEMRVTLTLWRKTVLSCTVGPLCTLQVLLRIISMELMRINLFVDIF